MMSRGTAQSTSNQWTGPPPPRPLAHRTYQNSVGIGSTSSGRRTGSGASAFESESRIAGSIGQRFFDSGSGGGFDDNPGSFGSKVQDGLLEGGARSGWGGGGLGATSDNWRSGGGFSGGGFSGGADDEMDSSAGIMSRGFGGPSTIMEQEITVPKEDVGRIIGKSGNTIKDIKTASGAEIKVHSELATVKFKGTPDAIDRAKVAIRKIIGGDGMVILRDIDEQSMGYLSKRMFLKDLQDQLGVQVEMDRRTLRVISSSGDTSMAKEAVERIKERIEHRNLHTTVRLPIPRSTYKLINQDPLLQQLKDNQGISIVLRRDDESLEVEISGIRGVVEEAAECVHTIATGGGTRDYVNIFADLLNECKPKKYADLKADVQRYVQGRGDVTVELKPEESRAVIGGTPETVPQAKEELEKILVYYFAGNCLSIELGTDAVEDICGEGDRLLSRMQARDLMASVDKEAGRMWLTGSSESLQSCKERVESQLEKFRSCNHKICLEDADVLGWIIGTKGENVRRIEEKTGARITVANDLIIQIQSNDPRNVLAARRTIMEIVHSYEEQRGQGSSRDRREDEREGGGPTRAGY